MERRKELKRLYKEEKKAAGVFLIKNLQNHKVFIKTSVNLKSINGQQFQLNHGSHPNKQLQKEWREFGPDAFAFEVLEVLKQETAESGKVREALKELEAKWLAQLQPYDERGYH